MTIPNENERLAKAFQSEHFIEVCGDIPALKVGQILRAFMEVDSLPKAHQGIVVSNPIGWGEKHGR